MKQNLTGKEDPSNQMKTATTIRAVHTSEDGDGKASEARAKTFAGALNQGLNEQ